MKLFDAHNSTKIPEPYVEGNPELLAMFKSKVFDYAESPRTAWIEIGFWVNTGYFFLPQNRLTVAFIYGILLFNRGKAENSVMLHRSKSCRDNSIFVILNIQSA